MLTIHFFVLLDEPPPPPDYSAVSDQQQPQQRIPPRPPQQQRRQTIGITSSPGGNTQQSLIRNLPKRQSTGGDIAGGGSVASGGSDETEQTTGTFMTTVTANIPITQVPQWSSSTTMKPVKGAYFINNPVIQAKCRTICYTRRPDKTRAQCFKCKKGFGFRTQRHHCRSCGDVYW